MSQSDPGSSGPTLHQSILKTAMDGFWVVDAKGRLLEVNDAYCRMSGYDERTLLGMRIHDLEASESAAETDASLQRIEGLGSARFESRHRRKDGSFLDVEVSVQHRPGEGGRYVVFLRDVTERRQAQERLRQSEANLRQAQAAAKLGSWRWEVQTNRLEWSDGMYRVFGVDKASFSGDLAEVVARSIHPEDRHLVEASNRAVVEGGRGKAMHYRVVWPDGSVHVVLAGPGDHEVDAQGNVVALSGFAQDITERVRSDEALRASEARLAQAVALAGLGIWDWEPATDRTAWNDEMLRIYGITRESFTGRGADYISATRADYRERQAANIREDFAAGVTADRFHSGEFRRPPVRELCVVRPDGSERFTLGSAVTVVDAEGRAVRMIGVTQDVTERRKTERSLRLLAAAVEQTPASVMITDPKGAIEYVNPAFERATGFFRAEVLGQRPRILAGGAQPDEAHRALWAELGAGRSWQGRFIDRKKSGEQFVEDVVISPIRDEQGEVCNLVSVARDVTKELALQQQLADARKLEGIGRLAGGVAHDFNNILSVILSDAEELERREAPAPSFVAEMAREITDAGLRARDLTTQLLAFARKQLFSPVALDLNQALHRSERLLRRVLGEDIVLEVRAQPGLWKAHCDPSQVEQVILNLAVNARDAMVRGGRLTLETSQLAAGDPAAAAYAGLAPGDYVQLSVTDTGAGMPPEIVARLFEPFFTTKEVGKGTGLGLATVHGIVTQSGGAIRCESEPGKGTRFLLCLPRATGPATRAVHPSPASRVKQGSERILLVEDDPHVRRTSLRTLEAAGYEVWVAPDGLAALEVVRDEALQGVALVVTDVVMPGLDGGALVDALRARAPGLRALFVSGHTDDAISDHGVLPDGVAFLPKPFTGNELLARVRRVLDER
jgi:PAS domain S-box-containing protein